MATKNAYWCRTPRRRGLSGAGAASTSDRCLPAGAGEGTRTPTPLFTRALLYRVSYSGPARAILCALGPPDAGRALEVAVAVGRQRLRMGRHWLAIGRVEPTLELAQHDAEDQVAPGRLRERGRVGRERGQLVAGGVQAVGERGGRPRGEVLGQRGGPAAGPRRQRQAPGDRRVERPARRAVEQVQGQAGDRPRAAPRDELAQQLRVVIGHPEHAAVQRLLRRPDGGGGRAGDGAADHTSAVDRHRRSVPEHARPPVTMPTPGRIAGMDRRGTLLERSRTQGVDAPLYWLLRAVLQPVFHVYFRMGRTGREHLPRHGPMIIAANHRSFLDPFVIAMLARRPIYFVAKRELFRNRFVGWLLNSLGAFPIERGTGDADAIQTARAILQRGDGVLIFPEGTRIRPGGLGRPRRGVGRLALQTGAPVVPVAVFGTQDVRRGWRIRPHQVRLRVGPPLRFPRVEDPSPALAAAVTARIWPCVELQWEGLGGAPALLRAAVVGAGEPAAALAAVLARAGLEVRLGVEAGEAALDEADLVCLAVPARELPAVVAAYGPHVPRRAALLVAAPALVQPRATAPADYVAARLRARALATLAAGLELADASRGDAPGLVGSPDRGLLGARRDVLARAGLRVRTTPDVGGVGVTTTTSPE